MLVYCVLVDNIERISPYESENDINNYKITSTRLDSVYANYDHAVARKEAIDDELNVEEYAYVREYEVR